MGFEGRTASSTVPEEAVPRLRASGGRVKPGSKPRAATAEQLPTRRPARARKEPRRPAGDGEGKSGVGTAGVDAPRGGGGAPGGGRPPNPPPPPAPGAGGAGVPGP